MIPGGNLRDVEAVAKHYFYEGQRSGSDSQVPLAFMGAVTVAIGATMLWTAYQKHTKFVDGLRKAGKPHAERVGRQEHHEQER